METGHERRGGSVAVAGTAARPRQRTSAFCFTCLLGGPRSTPRLRWRAKKKKKAEEAYKKYKKTSRRVVDRNAINNAIDARPQLENETTLHTYGKQ